MVLSVTVFSVLSSPGKGNDSRRRRDAERQVVRWELFRDTVTAQPVSKGKRAVLRRCTGVEKSWAGSGWRWGFVEEPEAELGFEGVVGG